jgi:decaprenylphospho-beta-D-ribofuranose 2-oxidase
MKLSGWGRYPTIETQRYNPMSISDLQRYVQAGFTGIVCAMGRSYGDSALAKRTIAITALDHVLEFDSDTGVVQCEAGVTFAELLEVFVPKGWFPPVTPGTKFVSIGGAIASDIHGKTIIMKDVLATTCYQ